MAGVSGPIAGLLRVVPSEPPAKSVFGILGCFLLIGLLLGVVDGAVRVVCGTVYRVQEQRNDAGVDEVVPRAGRNNNQVPLSDRADLPVNEGFTGSRDERQKLIIVLVYFVANLPSGGNGHDDQLAVLSGP